MRLKWNYELIDMGDEIFAIPVGDGADVQRFVIRLNSSAVEIFNLLKDEISEDEIVAKLSEKYENKEEIAVFVKNILNEYAKKGILCGDA